MRPTYNICINQDLRMTNAFWLKSIIMPPLRSRGGGILWRAPSRTPCYHCWAGCCECATAVQFFKVTELLCLVGNKSDSSGKYYSSPVQPSCTAVNNMPCTFILFIGLYSSIYHFQMWQFLTL